MERQCSLAEHQAYDRVRRGLTQNMITIDRETASAFKLFRLIGGDQLRLLGSGALRRLPTKRSATECQCLSATVCLQLLVVPGELPGNHGTGHLVVKALTCKWAPAAAAE